MILILYLDHFIITSIHRDTLRKMTSGIDMSSSLIPSAGVQLYPMPLWLDDCTIDNEWITQKTGITGICHTIVQDVSNQSRRGTLIREGGTLLVTLHFDIDATSKRNQQPSQQLPQKQQQEQQQLIIKQVDKSNDRQVTISRQLGLAREACFYTDLAPFLPSNQNNGIPKIWYSYGNNETGEKCIIMEYLDPTKWLDSGLFFGPGNPNNWNRDLPFILNRSYLSSNIPSKPPTSASVAYTTFREIARVHAYFWNKEELLLHPNFHWLRGHGWIQQKSRETWEASQNLIRTIWSKYCQDDVGYEQQEERQEQKKIITWDPVVRLAVEKSISSISWENQINRLCVSGHWTLVHGDFWPGNVMWDIQNEIKRQPQLQVNEEIDKCNIRILDWEMVGLGSGPQDLGQYVLSNFSSQERRECEHEIVHAYHNELCLAGRNDVSFEYCWNEYMIGGVERWLWFLIWFLGQGESLQGWAQFFHDQIADFMHDHNISEANISQPRP
jgi:Protein of unknown function (DUF1679)